MPGVDGAFGGEHRNGRQWRVKAATNYFPLTRDFSQPTRDSYSGLALMIVRAANAPLARDVHSAKWVHRFGLPKHELHQAV